MPDAIDLRRLLYTPFRDLIGGRITGRLDWRKALADSGLPAPARALIERVVRRAGLWNIERPDVAAELTAHFADALAAGVSVDDAIRSFGDERQAARLIRRATHRNRPLAWHAAKYVARALLVLLAIYGVLVVRFVTARPTPRVDYVPLLNAATDRVPPAERAWPLYRDAASTLRADGHATTAPLAVQDPDLTYVRTLEDARPTDVEWPQLGAWLDAHAAQLDAIRAAAARPTIGFVYELADDGSYAHRAVLRTADWEKPARPDAPNPNLLNAARFWLTRDLAWAVDRGLGERATADLRALLGMARQERSAGELWMQVSAARDARDTFRRLAISLRGRPALFDDAQLVALAHAVAAFDGEVAGDLFRLDAAAMVAHDRVQRLYTDDGHGDGRLAPDALPLSHNDAPSWMGSERRMRIMVGAVLATRSSRAAVERTIDRTVADARARLARPARDFTSPDDWRFDGGQPEAAPRSAFGMLATLVARGPADPTEYLDVGGLQRTAEVTFAQRDATLVALALEAYRRRHGGAYPPSLDALVPALLPRVPVDRIDGNPMRYRVVDGAPVLYSVGVDRDDDGGRAPTVTSGVAGPGLAAQWVWAGHRPMPDGDWILYDGRPARAGDDE